MHPASSRAARERLRRADADGRHHPLGTTIRQTLADIGRKLVIFLFNQVGVGCLLLGYTMSGAFVFRHTESEYDLQLQETVLQQRRRLAHALWDITLQLNQFNVTESEWWQTVTNLTQVYQSNVTGHVRRGYLGASSDGSLWTVPASIIYCISIYSTIGYGYLTPHTTWGKICTVVYAILGIPLMLLYMSNIGAVLAHFFKFAYARMCKRTRRVPMGISYASMPGSGRPSAISVEDGVAVLAHRAASPETEQAQTVPIAGCVLVMGVYVFAGGILFAEWENWSYLDGSWFCYISLVSVGFGDLIPGFSVHEFDDGYVDVKLIICAVYLLLGMSLIAMCFSLMQEDAIGKLRRFMTQIGCLRPKQRTVDSEWDATTSSDQAPSAALG